MLYSFAYLSQFFNLDMLRYFPHIPRTVRERDKEQQQKGGLDDLETVAMAGSGARGDDKLFIASDHNEQD